jgi:hypothetical protein
MIIDCGDDNGQAFEAVRAGVALMCPTGRVLWGTLSPSVLQNDFAHPIQTVANRIVGFHDPLRGTLTCAFDKYNCAKAGGPHMRDTTRASNTTCVTHLVHY